MSVLTEAVANVFSTDLAFITTLAAPTVPNVVSVATTYISVPPGGIPVGAGAVVARLPLDVAIPPYACIYKVVITVSQAFQSPGATKSTLGLGFNAVDDYMTQTIDNSPWTGDSFEIKTDTLAIQQYTSSLLLSVADDSLTAGKAKIQVLFV